MSSDTVDNGIRNILLNGINLKLETIEEEEYYMDKLHQYFQEETEFSAYLRKDFGLEIETKDLQLGMEVHITKSTLFMIPYSTEVFPIFTEVLRFISQSHTQIIKEFRGTEEIKIERPKDLSDRMKNDIKEETSEEESSSDDDFEWI